MINNIVVLYEEETPIDLDQWLYVIYKLIIDVVPWFIVIFFEVHVTLTLCRVLQRH